MPGPGWKAAVEATLRIPPRRRSIISGSKSLVRCVRLVMLTCNISSCRLRGSSTNLPCAPNPALLTNTSTLRPALCRWARRRVGDSGCARSAVKTCAWILWAFLKSVASASFRSDQHVHLETGTLQVGQETGRGFRVCEVRGEDLRLDFVGLPQIGRERFQRIALACHQSEPTAIGGEATRQLKPNA